MAGCFSKWKYVSGFSLAAKHHIPYPMPQTNAALLELGERAIFGAWRITRRRVLQQRFRTQHRQYLFGVILPVGGDMEVAARLELLRQLRDKRRLDQAALVVARLVPRIGEKDMHAGERRVAEHVAQHFHGVVLDDADVGDLLR